MGFRYFESEYHAVMPAKTYVLIGSLAAPLQSPQEFFCAQDMEPKLFDVTQAGWIMIIFEHLTGNAV